ncbi:hypothetical protein L6164_019521 [Bauhinia variegata]|uniref:Uncharacterized protein n=1 Tax=Bauhinia variegata TaxID=167791 RepID=A0ACB9MVK2_BAUVA|nr:hypothetical protein L6164_019521 [Bauhinia variegata]
MDILRESFDESNYCYAFPLKAEASSSSETSCSNRPVAYHSLSHSDEEESVILASSTAKKRAGRRIFKETRHPVYRGVRRRNNNKWVCELRVPNDKARIWLGTYPTPEMAARAHDVAALALRGKSACLNFADSAWRLPLPSSTDANEIRRVAAKAAQQFGHVCVHHQQNINLDATTTTTDYQVCNSTVGVMQQAQGLHLDLVPEIIQYDDLHHLLLTMADEPLRSPPPAVIRDGRDWDDVDFDSEVSLWSFSI